MSHLLVFLFIKNFLHFNSGKLIKRLLEQHLISLNDFILFIELIIDLFRISDLNDSWLTIIFDFLAALWSIWWTLDVLRHSQCLLARSLQRLFVLKNLDFCLEFFDHGIKVVLLGFKLNLEFLDQPLVFPAWVLKVLFQLPDLSCVCNTFFLDVLLKLWHFTLEIDCNLSIRNTSSLFLLEVAHWTLQSHGKLFINCVLTTSHHLVLYIAFQFKYLLRLFLNLRFHLLNMNLL